MAGRPELAEGQAIRLAVCLLNGESNVLSLSKDQFTWTYEPPMYFIYILRCRDGSYYVGSTQDVAARMRVHQSGKGPIFTANRLPVELVYQETLQTIEAAVRRERQLKGWSRAKKEALISGDTQRLRELAAAQKRSTV